jgi:hypothetical protein
MQYNIDLSQNSRTTNMHLAEEEKLEVLQEVTKKTKKREVAKIRF